MPINTPKHTLTNSMLDVCYMSVFENDLTLKINTKTRV